MSSGILTKKKNLTESQIRELENQILVDDKIVFYLKPNGKIGMLSQEPIDSDIDDIAWHKLTVIEDGSPDDIKQKYKRIARDEWVLEEFFSKADDDIFWTESNTSAILGKALLGKMILGRRY
jgi:hypothetical protein